MPALSLDGAYPGRGSKMAMNVNAPRIYGGPLSPQIAPGKQGSRRECRYSAYPEEKLPAR